MKTKYLLLIAGAAGAAYLWWKHKQVKTGLNEYISYEEIVEFLRKQPSSAQLDLLTGEDGTYYAVITDGKKQITCPITEETYTRLQNGVTPTKEATTQPLITPKKKQS